MYQWQKDRARQADVRVALAGALTTDLTLWAQALREHYARHEDRRLTSEKQFKEISHALSHPRMPTFERFYAMLPDLGMGVSAPVVSAYTEVMRQGELIANRCAAPGITDRDHVGIVVEFMSNFGGVHNAIARAIAALEPYVGKK
jgi:hypothetical protein